MSAAPAPTTVLVCTGRPVDEHLQPVGDPCGRRYAADAVMVPDDPAEPGVFPPWTWRPATEQETVQEARAAGWTIGPGLVAMCPTCRRPDPQVVADCRHLQASILTDQEVD